MSDPRPDLSGSVFTPYKQWTDEERAYWDDFCACEHTRLDHGLRGCDRCRRTRILRRPVCRAFDFAETLDERIERTKYDGPLGQMLRQIEERQAEQGGAP